MNDFKTHTSLNQAKFDEWASSYEDKRFDFFRRMQKRVLSILGLKGDSAFLDIGCGTGWAVRQAATMIGERGAAYGIDLSPKMIEKANEAASGIKNVRFIQANAEQIPFPDDFFDHIICTMSFHHYLHPAAVMREIARVLKPRGIVCIVDPTTDSFILKWADALIK
ncbi:MAG TPA: class I SAM-dependent methyltransferase, partial [Spirochaetia bacterium]|nr:class I SAM-dependent methyltransferase [Spirochaetia bacterium]